jgi:hypothetical protein
MNHLDAMAAILDCHSVNHRRLIFCILTEILDFTKYYLAFLQAVYRLTSLLKVLMHCTKRVFVLFAISVFIICSLELTGC